MNYRTVSRTGFLLSTALAGVFVPGLAFAQSADDDGYGLEEIVVTAQKREQSLQDVPIAVTAVTQDTIVANRISTVNDLSAIAPGVTVKPSAGGISVPTFTMRGQVSFGVVAGSDKQVSVYLDGVYIGSPRGSIFDLPDIQRLEVLRGPQGTLFGRNATAGAVSVTTRDPSGEFHVKLQGSIGDQSEYRIRGTVETPEIGPLSGLFSFQRRYRHGDIRNAGAGVLWDRTLSSGNLAIKATSAPYLGTVDSNSYFAAVKFEQGDFRLVYKFDRNDDKGSPEGTAFLGYNPSQPLASGGPLLDGVLAALYGTNASSLYTLSSLTRPDVVSNSFAIPRQQVVYGHSATATWNASDNITVKNIFAYRFARVFAPSPIDGTGALTITPQMVGAVAALKGAKLANILALYGVNDVATNIGLLAAGLAPTIGGFVGGRFLTIDSQASSISKQWSDELVVNYSSDNLQLTAGLLWFHSKDEAGGPVGIQNTFSLALIPTSGVIPLGNEGRYFNSATSLAAYAQLEYKITPELEIVGGIRVTKDTKNNAFRYDVSDPYFAPLSTYIQNNLALFPALPFVAAAQNITVAQLLGGLNAAAFNIPSKTLTDPTYRRTKPNYMIGFNYKPNTETLIYGKFSTSFVSGGSVSGINFQPETARSFEIGAKVDWFDRRLRTNLALFDVVYQHFQSPQSTTAIPSRAICITAVTATYGSDVSNQLCQPGGALSTFIAEQGTVHAQGFELEVTAAPTRDLQFGGSLSYTKVNFPYFTAATVASNAGNNGVLDVTQRPAWTANFFGSYQIRPFNNDTALQFRLDGQWRSNNNNELNRSDPATNWAARRLVSNIKPYWVVNGRVALSHLPIGPMEGEIAFWVKNMFDNKSANFVLATDLAVSANFIPARSLGVDIGLQF